MEVVRGTFFGIAHGDQRIQWLRDGRKGPLGCRDHRGRCRLPCWRGLHGRWRGRRAHAATAQHRCTGGGVARRDGATLRHRVVRGSRDSSRGIIVSCALSSRGRSCPAGQVDGVGRQRVGIVFVRGAVANGGTVGVVRRSTVRGNGCGRRFWCLLVRLAVGNGVVRGRLRRAVKRGAFRVGSVLVAVR